ncbi:hypothetical protein D1007_08737 [Hordeum vulgare]|nr:hypothetical protein D1007_08737 [Hordeum vulgare]
MAFVPYSGGLGTARATSVPLLTGENFITRAIKVEADLDAAGLWEAVVPSEDAALAVIAKNDKPTRAYQVCRCQNSSPSIEAKLNGLTTIGILPQVDC